ncbi:MAG: peroxiredoxin-like family protein [Actinomycetota bacterium]
MVGDLAPDADLLGLDRKIVRLSDFWERQPIVLVFLRYFGCPFCQAQVAELKRDEPRFREAGAGVVLVGHGHPGAAEAFSAKRRLPFPLLMDPWRDAYESYGLREATFGEVVGPRALPQMLRRGLAKDTRQGGLHGGSLKQMPGTFVIDTGGVIRHDDGIVRLVHRNRDVADAPSNDAILDVLLALRTEPA